MNGKADRPTPARRKGRTKPHARLKGLQTQAIRYRWDIATDQLTWGPGAARFFGLSGLGRLKRGQTFAEHLASPVATSRAHAILFTHETDEGSGVPYRASYPWARPDGSLLWLDDNGRWFAGRDGRPAFAEGLVRPAIDPDTHARTIDTDCLTALTYDFDRLTNEGGQAALMAFTLPSRDQEADASDLLPHLRHFARIGDRVGMIGPMAILFARSCAAERATEAAQRIAATLTERIGQPVANIALRIPQDATRALAALQRAEQDLITPQSQSDDPLSRALRALNARTIAMARQPIVTAGARTIAFYETLARIPDEKGGYEPTEELVCALEAHGSIALLDHRILSLAIDTLETDPTVTLAVNVAPRSLTNADWFRYAEVRLARRPDLSSRLIFEITEHADLAMLAHAKKVLESLRTWGLRIAIDDFGMGRTSLRHLKDLQIDILKIAGPFIQNLGRSIEDRHFVGALIDLTRQLNIQTIAEWVEDEATAQFLEERGIDFMQGQLFGGATLASSATEHHRGNRRRASARR